ncbi:junctional adhesion molecule-like [Oreochromis niloticus]|uniref:junctional adhesion molecule-like n=1 Tax=Oreochromis niloticus TaxID=8128 RepID=UPI000DF41A90|nr:junctional adhesion molecule-like [Oreochromis niloticus]
MNHHPLTQAYRGLIESILTAGITVCLTLKDLHLTDSGVYTCTVYNKDGHMLLQKSVTLSVRVLQVEMVEVSQGQTTVLIPFIVTDDLSQDVKVEWKLTCPEEKMIHLYDSSKKQHLSQDPVYRGHTEMNEDPLNTKDLSLKLKDLHLTDSGVYTCTVYKKYGNILLQKVVTLKVKGSTKSLTGAQSKNTDASVVKPADE